MLLVIGVLPVVLEGILQRATFVGIVTLVQRELTNRSLNRLCAYRVQDQRKFFKQLARTLQHASQGSIQPLRVQVTSIVEDRARQVAVALYQAVNLRLLMPLTVSLRKPPSRL